MTPRSAGALSHTPAEAGSHSSSSSNELLQKLYKHKLEALLKEHDTTLLRCKACQQLFSAASHHKLQCPALAAAATERWVHRVVGCVVGVHRYLQHSTAHAGSKCCYASKQHVVYRGSCLSSGTKHAQIVVLAVSGHAPCQGHAQHTLAVGLYRATLHLKLCFVAVLAGCECCRCIRQTLHGASRTS